MRQEKSSYEIFPKDPNKSYGLMELLEGTSPLVEKEPENTVMVWPRLVMAELCCIMFVLLALHLVSAFFNAPLEEIANPAVNPNPDKAPWYFLGLQELVSWGPPIWGGIVVPGAIVLALLLLPYLDREPVGVGTWFARERRLACVVFALFALTMAVLIFIGMFCRGPNWDFYWPWQEWPTEAELQAAWLGGA